MPLRLFMHDCFEITIALAGPVRFLLLAGAAHPLARQTFQKQNTPQPMLSASGHHSGLPISPSQARKM